MPVTSKEIKPCILCGDKVMYYDGTASDYHHFGEHIICMGCDSQFNFVSLEKWNNLYRPISDEEFQKKIENVKKSLKEIGSADIMTKTYIEGAHGYAKEYIGKKDYGVRT